MTPSEVGMEYLDLKDIVEREGIDLPEHLGAMEKAGSKQCASEATRSYPIPFYSKGGIKIQRGQAYTR
jgi:hypothetical protein